MGYHFPENFWRGSTCSTSQTEGDSLNDGKNQTTWNVWLDCQPGRFHQGIDPAIILTLYQHWRRDIALFKQLKHSSFRTSLSWSHLIPDGTDGVSPEAVEFYNNVIDELPAQGVTPFITLFHFDMPMVIQEKGGWENREVVEAFGRYAQTCFTLFGNRVGHWFAFNESIVPVKGGYLYDFHYSNMTDFKRAAAVTYHTVLVHSTAVRAYRAVSHDGGIGVVLNLTSSYPRSQNPVDVEATHYADLLLNRSFLDLVLKGKYPAGLVELLKEYDQSLVCQPGDSQLTIEGKIDLLGISYYQPCRVKHRDSTVNSDTPFMLGWLLDCYEMPGQKMNPYRDWEVYKPGTYDIVTNLRDDYGSPRCFILENDVGVENKQRFIQQEQINDSYCIGFISEHLKWLHKGISEGYDCPGYHIWTFIDNRSWPSGCKNRCGFVQLDLAAQKHTMKKSGEWFAQIAGNNGSDQEENNIITLEEAVMEIVVNIGQSRSLYFEALHATRTGNVDEAKSLPREADSYARQVHHIQTELIEQDVGETRQPTTLIMVHAQGHLMTSLLVRGLSEEVIHLYQRQSLIKHSTTGKALRLNKAALYPLLNRQISLLRRQQIKLRRDGYYLKIN